METINTNRNVVNPRDRNGDINPTILYTFKDEDTSSNQPTPHREDGPALIFRKGAEQWYTHGDITKGIPNRIQENGMEYWCGKTIYPSGISHAY